MAFGIQDASPASETNGIVERFHKTMLLEFYQVAFRKKLYRSIEKVQTDLDEWMQGYNEYIQELKKKRFVNVTPKELGFGIIRQGQGRPNVYELKVVR